VTIQTKVNIYLIQNPAASKIVTIDFPERVD